ncbi:neutral cholesterol ester hydrolase 1-like [Boleophthalmus pectinirostris]|uniref:neutral cholesterol ester hydrolase 1-like n=1 Tax=Boleophthalmus pectinirostris TaxID=150288 RepID=UPI000A1C6B01|nr:neutral cholesterol ester hydrolase 1-like [Boleophthalmus pectinirostris]
MRPFLIITLLLTVALAYYVYTPLPDALDEKWKLMSLDVVLRTTMHYAALKHWLGYDHYIHTIRNIAGSLDPPPDPDFLPGVKVRDETFAGVPVRVYEASGGEGSLRRGLMYFHGGGWALGSAKGSSYDRMSRILAHELNAVVVSVEYRLYPEVQFPVPYLDCLAATKHFLSSEVLSKYSVDPDRVGVSGDSAGGNLAAAVSQEISQGPDISIKFSVQALIYPALQALDFNTPSDLQNHNIPVLPLDDLIKYWMQYLGIDLSLRDQVKLNRHSSLQQTHLTPELRARFDWKKLLSPKYHKNNKLVVAEKGLAGIIERVPALLDVRASPLLADTGVLSKCPKAYIMTCEFDVLRDDGFMYARRLEEAGVQVTSVHYDDGFHGCFSFVSNLEFKVAQRAVRDYMSWLQENL